MAVNEDHAAAKEDLAFGPWSPKDGPSAGFGPGSVLAYLGGARRDALGWMPGATSTYAGMAMVLIGTATVASLSAGFALNMAVHPPTWALILLSVFWGLLIFNLDRLFLVTLAKSDGLATKVAGVLARMLVAASLAIVISTPVTLEIFRPEINEQLGIQEQKEITNDRTSLAKKDKELLAAQADQTKAQEALQVGASPSPAQQRAITAAQTLVTEDEANVNKLEAAVDAEADGTGGSGHVGCSTVCHTKEKSRDYAERTLMADRATLKAAQGQADTATAASRTAEEQALVTARNTIAQIDKTQAAQLAQQEAKIKASDGLLARVQALWALGGTSAAALWTHLFLFLLFFTIELLPILVKTLSLFRPETEYEKVVANIDKANLKMLRGHRSVLIGAVRVHTEQQLNTAEELGRLTLAAQKDVFLASLEEWKRQAVLKPNNIRPTTSASRTGDAMGSGTSRGAEPGNASADGPANGQASSHPNGMQDSQAPDEVTVPLSGPIVDVRDLAIPEADPQSLPNAKPNPDPNAKPGP